MFTVYSKPNCPYCDQAKALLTQKDLPYTAINIDVGQPKVDGEQYISRDDIMAKYPTLRTVPFILNGDVKIGGYIELRSYLQQQEVSAA
jgi:glutaredoxin